MASRGNGKAKVDEEYLRSVWDWAQEIEVTHKGRVQLALTRASRPGCWKVAARLFVSRGDAPPSPIHSMAGEFPNARAVTLGGYMMQLLIQLDKLAGTPAQGERPTDQGEKA